MAKLSRFWQQLSSRERVIISIGIVIGIIFLTVNYVFDPIYAAYQRMQDDLEAQQNLLKRYEHLVETSDKARDKLLKMKTIEQGISQILLDSETSDLANAELQGLVKTIAQKADISFSRITPNKSIEENGFIEVGLKVPFKGTIRQIELLLFELEQAPKFIQVKKLFVRNQRSNQTELDVDLELAAFIRGGAESTPPTTEPEKEKSEES